MSTLEKALANPRAKFLVHGTVSRDASGNSRARQVVLADDGEILHEDGRRRSYWYSTENERKAFERRGGVVVEVRS